MPTKDRIISFHAALRAAQLTENKGDMLASYGVSSTKQLSNEQIDALIAKINEHTPPPKESTKAVRKARYVVLCLLTDMGVMKHSRDWDSVNAYLCQPQVFGRRLNQTEDVDELKQLQRKLRVLLKKRKEKIDLEDYHATNN